MVIIVPEVPIKLLDVPPPKTIFPIELEKIGSVVHKLNIEPLLEREITWSSAGLKITVPSAALTVAPPLSTLTFIEKVLSTA